MLGRQQGTRPCPSISRKSEMLSLAPQESPLAFLELAKKDNSIVFLEGTRAGMGGGISRQFERIKG